jgi:XTP/dITP diphosphohydrolase
VPTLADDSGLEVEALGAAPGVRSHRYAGPNATDEANNRKLLRELSDVPVGRRAARYVCALAFLPEPGDGPVVREGTLAGRIAFDERGSGGFGYDPWFVPEGGSRTMAELTPAEKHAISHRGKALRALAGQLESVLGESA